MKVSKAFVELTGDPSVGIPSTTMFFDFKVNLDEDQIQQLRCHLRHMAASVFDEGTGFGVRFENECPDCGKLMEWCEYNEWQCLNHNCIGV